MSDAESSPETVVLAATVVVPAVVAAVAASAAKYDSKSPFSYLGS